jgi:3-oxoadipate enol-lactonase
VTEGSLVDAFADFVGTVRCREVDLPWGRAQAWDEGEGEPLVLLHGLAAGRRSFFRLVPLLARARRVIVPPLRGEDLPAPRATWAQLLDDVRALLDALGLSGTTLFGFSLGGALALAYGAQRDPRVRAIRVQGAFAGLRLRPADGLAHLLSYALPASVGAAYFAHRVRKGPEAPLLAAHAPGMDELFPRWCQLTPFATLRRRVALVRALDLAADVAAIRVPLAFAHGEKDRVVPRARFEELSRLRPDAPATLLEGVGHNAALTHPEALAAWLLA